MFNLKEICKQKEHVRPHTLFDYMVRYFTASDSLVLWSIFNTNYMPADVTYYLAQYDWFAFISTNKVNFPLPLVVQHQFTLTDILTAHIYNNYSRYEFLPKISLLFTFDDFTTSDLHILRDIIDSTVANVLYTNAERYEKLFKANTLEFNPLWNVDGTETTTRTLERDGFEKTTHDGSDTALQTNNNTDKTTYNTTEKLTRDTTDKLTIDANTKTTYNSTDTITYNAETEKTTYNNTLQKNGQENTTIATSKNAFNSATATPTETTHNDLEFDSRQDRKTGDDTILRTGGHADAKSGYDSFENDATETTKHTGDDTNKITGDDTILHTGTITNKTDYDSYTKTDIDTVDTERIEHVRQGNIGVTTTTKLLTEYVDFANYFNFIDTICHDIVSELCYMTL